MDYTPREGVDYIVDLYQLAGIPQDAAPDDTKQALNDGLQKYHPDKLQSLAPEFQARGEHVARLLNKAKGILLDPDKRSQYDQILEEWQGPVSTDGVPVMAMDDAMRIEVASRTPAELEDRFTKMASDVADMVRHDPNQQALLGQLYGAASGPQADSLATLYDAALFAEDQVLAIGEKTRGQLLGITVDERYEATLDYAAKQAAAIEAAREEQKEAGMRRALGGMSTRLALLAGETPPQDIPTSDVVSLDNVLPQYFDPQAAKVREIAARRQELLQERLRIFQPTYPLAEIQTEAQPRFAVGVTTVHDGEPTATWLTFSFDPAHKNLVNMEVPGDIERLLQQGQFETVYNGGYNVLTFSPKEHIELHMLLEEACNKHVNRYYPGVLGK